jgi:mycothiol synthase
VIRPARRDDLAAVVAVMNAVDVATLGEPDTTEADIGAGWAESDFDLASDAVVAEEAGTIVGYGEVYVRGESGICDVDVYVHPDAGDDVRRGVFDAVMERGEQTKPGTTLATWLPDGDPSVPLYAEAGFEGSRRFLRMRMELTDPVEIGPEPDGIRLASARAGVDEPVVHDVLVEAFAHHVRPMTSSWERFAEQHLQHPNFNAELWGVAWDGDQAVGALNLFDHGDIGMIRYVGVRNGYRERGIGSALLRRGLAALQARGQTRVDLGVDLDDEVGAARLYERIGFRTLQETMLVEKRL